MRDIEITIEVVQEGIGVLSWHDIRDHRLADLAAGAFASDLETAVDDAFASRGLHRVETTISDDDLLSRRALMRAGFRLEGRRRQAIADGDRWHDQLIFARLDDDRVHGPDGFSGVMNSALPRKRLIAHVVMRDEAGRVLLCETQFKADWELPGGIVEPDESPRSGAIREIKEELGIDIELGRLLAVDWMPHYLGWDDALELIFDGGTVTEAEIARYILQPTEIKAVRLIDVAAAESHLTSLSYRRLSAIAALDPDRTLTMENGRPI